MSDDQPSIKRSKRSAIISGILMFVALLTILQLWLLQTTMNAYLGGDFSILLPAALVSLASFVLNLGLLWYIYRLDRRPR